MTKKQLHDLWDALIVLHSELMRSAAGDPLGEKLDHLYLKVSEMLDELEERLKCTS